MNCIRKFFITLLLLWGSGYTSEMCLKEKLSLASPGHYLVLEQNKIFTLLHISEVSENTIIIEEISIAAASVAKNSMNWKEWLKKGAPGHTSWIMSQINLQSGVFEKTFSFNHRGWIDMSDSTPFLTTLLNLRFKEIPHSERRRVGLPPGHNRADHRPIWNPRLVVNGQIKDHASFLAFRARWPSDGSELARKYVEIYLPDLSNQQEHTYFFPHYFPYWLEVEGKIGSAKIRAIDSGVDARSPKEYLPKCVSQS